MDQNQLQHFGALFGATFFCFAIVMAVVVLIPYWQIFKKAGFPPAITFLMLIPLVNIITLYVVAFSQWKVVPIAPFGYPPAYPPPPPPAYPPQVPPQV
jgi:Ca2+/Na+ antiporter